LVKVKICGITNLEDALAALFSGADAIGFVFYKKSPRYITFKKAANISRILPKKILKVGVFVNSKEKDIKKIAGLCALNMLQFHGEESPEFCARFKKHKVIKAFKVNKNLNFSQVREYKTFAYLFDAFSKYKSGGTGRKFDWNLLKKADRIKRPVFLSGGLNILNVKYALKALKPDWVDVSSALESSPGKKDHRKISDFIRKVK
jgi:phosphoribosylanthranilate isomerase